MNLNDFLIKSSRKDPKNGVYFIDDKIVRFIPQNHIDLIQSSENLKSKFPKIIKPYPNEFDISLSEIENIPFIIYPYELPFNLFKDYAIFYLKLIKNLLRNGYSLTDSSPFNITYTGKNEFIHLDLGSLERYQEQSGWKGYRQFLSEFYFPILYLKENKGIYPSDLVKLQFDKQWIHQYQFKTKNFLNLGFNIHYGFYKRSSIKRLNQEERNSILKSHQVEKNLILLQEHIKSFSLPKVKTKWDDYYSETVIKEGYVETKEKIFKELVCSIKNKSEIKFIVDWGANDGRFSELILQELNQSTVISIESDYNAINQLYNKNKDKKTIPVYADVLNLSPSLGFDGERESLKDRLKRVSDFQLCLGLIHHLIHQENLSFEHLINFFSSASKSKSYLLIEFIHAEDPRHQLISNPSYPYSLARDAFMDSLNKRYEILDSKMVIQTRELFLCIKRK